MATVEIKVKTNFSFFFIWWDRNCDKKSDGMLAWDDLFREFLETDRRAILMTVLLWWNRDKTSLLQADNRVIGFWVLSGVFCFLSVVWPLHKPIGHLNVMCYFWWIFWCWLSFLSVVVWTSDVVCVVRAVGDSDEGKRKKRNKKTHTESASAIAWWRG